MKEEEEAQVEEVEEDDGLDNWEYIADSDIEGDNFVLLCALTRSHIGLTMFNENDVISKNYFCYCQIKNLL